jgi:hypothetical protein
MIVNIHGPREVVAVYIDKPLIKGGVYQTALANPILPAGRGEVTEDRMFEMGRPLWERPSGLPWFRKIRIIACAKPLEPRYCSFW